VLICQGKIIKVKDRAFNDQRYFICDQKLASLGWVERTSWEEGLKQTIDWYLKHGFSSYWEHGDVEVRVLAVPALPRPLYGLAVEMLFTQ
jgi:UDP-glucose 4,6-dehydratase